MRPGNNAVLTKVFAANTYSSVPQWATDIVRASFQAVATDASAAGTIQVQASNDQAFGLPANQFQPTNWSNVGSAVVVSGVAPVITPEIECSYEYLRLVYTSTATGVQTVALVADVAGSLNSKYFLLNSGSNAHLYYVWFSINGAGIDPAIAGRTGIQVNGATNATAAALGTALAIAVAAVGGAAVFGTAGTSTVTITNLVAGPFLPASDGAAATGFTFTVTTGAGTVTARMKSMGL